MSSAPETSPLAAAPGAASDAAAPESRAPPPPRAHRRAGVLARLLGAVAGGYLRFVYATTRWRWVERGHFDARLADSAFVAVCWHGRIAPMPMMRPKHRRAVALISANRDGDVLQTTMAALGVEAIRGSSRHPRKRDKDKGGAAAASALVEALRAGVSVVITPDGPVGPRMRAKPGAIAVAAAAGVMVLPMSASFSRATVLKTWDRFMIPWPFGRGVMAFGPAIAPGAAGDHAAQEAARAALEASLIALTEQADRMIGREPVAPAPNRLRERRESGDADDGGAPGADTGADAGADAGLDAGPNAGAARGSDA